MLHSKHLKPGTMYCINITHIDFLQVFYLYLEFCTVLELTNVYKINR